MASSFLSLKKLQLLALVLSFSAQAAYCQSAVPGSTALSTELEQVTPGPLAAERQKLLDMILTAKEQKIGITAYMGALKSLDDQVKGGAQEKEIKGRLSSITESLQEQLKRSRELKVQRPAPPIAASSPSPSESNQSGGKGKFDMNGSSTDKMIDKIREKWFGGEIPDSIKKKIPAGIDPTKLDNDTIKELMKKHM